MQILFVTIILMRRQNTQRGSCNCGQFSIKIFAIMQLFLCKVIELKQFFELQTVINFRVLNSEIIIILHK